MSEFHLKKEKKALLDNLNYLKTLDVKEFTFQKKYDELQHKIKPNRLHIYAAEDGIWTPKDWEDEQLTRAQIQSITPKIIIADDKNWLTLWEQYRLFVSSGEYNPTPGRFIKFIVVDTSQTESTAHHYHSNFLTHQLPWPVLGIGAVSSDLPALGCRDTHIGWTKDQRTNGKLNHTAIGSTIVPTQPFGFNFLGGKLIAALITSEVIRNEWQLQFGDVLAGMTTTSLYGDRPSMYDGLEWWQRIGLSKGLVAIQPKPEIYTKWLKYIKKEGAEEFDLIMEQVEGVSGPVTNYKSKVLKMLFKAAGINQKDFIHGFERGVYFSEFYENTREFLCGRISESELRLKPLFRDDVNGIMNWWRKEAYGRYKMLKKQGRLKKYKHFYRNISKMDYETAKEYFSDEVGR